MDKHHYSELASNLRELSRTTSRLSKTIGDEPVQRASRTIIPNAELLRHYTRSPIVGIGEQFNEGDCEAQVFSLGAKNPEILLECVSPQDPGRTLDVVFVHGLSDDHRSTWSCGDFFWPECLFEDLPTIRVLLFQYDAKIWMQSDVEPIRKTARDMLSLLGKSRSRVGNSSTVWISHSLGGLLVKAAFNEKLQKSIELKSHDDTEQFIFFSTPHRAMSTRGWDRIYASIQEVAQEYTEIARTAAPLQHPNSLELGKLLQEFDLNLTPQNPILSLFEEHEAFNDSGPILVTTRQNASLYPSERVLYLPGNHVTICRFQSQGDAGYKVVLNALLEAPSRHISTESGSERPIEIPRSALELDIEQDLLRFKAPEEEIQPPQDVNIDSKTVVPASVVLQFAPTVNLRRVQRLLNSRLDPFQTRQNDILWYPHLNQPEVSQKSGKLPREAEEWLDSNQLQVLLIRGPRGSGKSSMSRMIVQHLDSMPDRYPIVLSYFSSGLIAPEKALFQMINKFLLQLLEINPPLIRHFPTRKVSRPSLRAWPWWDPAFEASSRVKHRRTPLDLSSIEEPMLALNHAEVDCGPFSLLELTEILTSMLCDSNLVGPRIMVIDGMDDTFFEGGIDSEASRQPLEHIKQLKSVLRLVSTATDVQVCLSLGNPIHLGVPTLFIDLRHDIRSANTGEETIQAIPRFESYQTLGFDTDVGARILAPIEAIAKKLREEHRWSYLWHNLVERITTELCKQGRDGEIQGLSYTLMTMKDGDPIYTVYEWLVGQWFVESNVVGYLMGFISLTRRPLSLGELTALISQPSDSILSPQQLDWPTNSGAQRKTIEITTKVQLFGLVTIKVDKVIVTDPSLKEFCLRYLQRHQRYCGCEYAMAVACLGVLDRYPVERNVHYAAENWDKHLTQWHRFEQSGGPKQWASLIALIQRVFSKHQQLLRAYSDRVLPPTQHLPINCILAAFDFCQLLEYNLGQDEPGVDQADTDLILAMQYAAVNSASKSLSFLRSFSRQKHVHDTKGLQVIDDFVDYGYAIRFADTLQVPEDLRQEWENIQNATEDTLSRYVEDSKLFPLPNLSTFVVWAVRTGDATLTERLLGYVGSNTTDSRDPQKPTLLHLAAAMGNARIVDILLQNGGRKRALDKDEKKPIHWAAERGHNDVVALLVSHSTDLDPHNRSPLFSACEAKSISTIRLLLNFGFNINLRDYSGRSPLHVAAVNGSPETVRLLIGRGVDLEAQDNRGISSLHLAAYGGWLPVTTELLSAGIPVDVKNVSGQTPLHYACKSPNPSSDVVQLLLDAQADPNAKDAKNQTPLHIACKNNSVLVVRLLLEACQSSNMMDMKDESGRTPLGVASKEENPEVFAFLQHLSQSEGATSDNRTPGISSISARRLMSQQFGSEYDGTGACVVFVHGLHGTPGVDAKDTLTNSKLLFWKYAYGVSDFVKQRQLQKLARTFLEAILSTVANEQDIATSQHSILNPQAVSIRSKPILFVAHSIGGILLKEALNIASRNNQYAEIRERTKGVVFLGTPHRATGLVAISDIIKGIFASPSKRPSAVKETLTFKRPSQDLLLSISSNDEFLDSVHSEFQAHSTRSALRVLLVSESLPTDGSRILVPTSAATYHAPPFTRTLVLPVDHYQLSQLSSLPVPGYAEIIGFLRAASELGSGSSSIDSISQPLLELTNEGFIEPHIRKSRRNPLLQRYSQLTVVGDHTSDEILAEFRAESINIDERLDSLPGEVLSSLLPSASGPSYGQAIISTWCRDRSARILWIKGKPGSGKTTLMKQFIRESQKFDIFAGLREPSETVITVPFFFSHIGKNQQSPEDMVRGLLYRIFTAQPLLVEEALREDLQSGLIMAELLHSLPKLRRLFGEVIRRSRNTLYCVFIDALDECGSHSTSTRGIGFTDSIVDPLRAALSCLEDLVHQSNVKICIASRAWVTIDDFCHRWDAEKVALDDENIQDIRRYAEERLMYHMSEYDRDDPAILATLTNEIVHLSHGLFVWARLITDQIGRGIAYGDTAMELRRLIDTLPADLEALYRKMLLSVPFQYSTETFQMLRLIASAQPPLNLVFLSLAMEGYLQDEDVAKGSSVSLRSNLRAINENQKIQASPDFSSIQRQTMRRVISRCSDFVEIVRSREVRFVHLTARDFVLTYLDKEPDKFDPYINLLSACIVRLKRFGLIEDSNEAEVDGSRYVTDAINYAKHADVHSQDSLAYVRLFDELCTVSLSLYRARSYIPKVGSHPFLLHSKSLSTREEPISLSPEQYSGILAVKNGLTNYIRTKLGQEALDIKDSLGRSLLLHAMLPSDYQLPWIKPVGFWDLPDPNLVRFLLSYGADPNESWKSAAMMSERHSLWELVLEYGYHCFAEDLVPSRPGPQQSTRNRDRWVAIMELFLKYGAHIDAEFDISFSLKQTDDDTDSIQTVEEPRERTVRKVVNPESAIRDNLKREPQYTESFKSLLALVENSTSRKPTTLRSRLRSRWLWMF